MYEEDQYRRHTLEAAENVALKARVAKLENALTRIARLWERDKDAPAVAHAHNMYDAKCIAREALKGE